MRRDSLEVERPPTDGQRQPWPGPWTAEQVVELLEPLVTARRGQRMLDIIARRLSSVTVLMDAPHDPHNGSAVVRSCDAFGVQELHVVERIEPFVVARRIARGTEHWVDIVSHTDVESAIDVLQRAGYELVSSAPNGELVPEDLCQLPRVALIFGKEHDGICAALEHAASRSVRVPMRGYVESLNVSVSAAILLHAATRGREGDLSEADKRWLYARGLFRTVPRASEVLTACATREHR